MIILLVILILLLAAGAAPVYPYNADWRYGWGPSGFLVTLLLILVVLYFLGMLPFVHLR